MTLQPLWDWFDAASIDTAPLGLLLVLFAIGAAVCAVIMLLMWLWGTRYKRSGQARRLSWPKRQSSLRQFWAFKAQRRRKPRPRRYVSRENLDRQGE